MCMRKILLFSISFAFLIGCSKDHVKKKINYYNWDPDITVVDSLKLDVNKDSIEDIMFLIKKDLQGISPSGGPYFNYLAQCLRLNPAVKISLGKLTSSSQQNYTCFKVNDLISNDNYWDTSLLLKAQIIAAGNVGCWDLNTSYGYLAIQVEADGGKYFGWIHLDVSYNGSSDKHYEFLLYDYALCETKNATLSVGEK